MLVAVPTPRLLAPDLLDQCLEALSRAEIEGGNVASRSTVPGDFILNFFDWHTTTEVAVAYMLPPAEIGRLLYSPRLWALRQMDPTGPAAKAWAELELRERRAALTAAHEALRDAQARWRRDDATIVVPDTNLLIHHGSDLAAIPWKALSDSRRDVRVVVLLQVIDELDRLKRTGQNHVRASARKVLKELAALGIAGTGNRVTVAQVEYAKTTIEVVGQERDHVRLPDADSEIIDQAVILGELAGRRVAVLTSDTGMQVRAGDADVEVRLVPTAT